MNPLQLDNACAEIPEGYTPYVPHSPYLALFEPLYIKPINEQLHAIATYVRPPHLNLVHVAHGGLLFSLADSVLGVNLRSYLQQPIVTVSMNSEFYAVARLGAWIEARPIIHKVGSRLVFAEAQVWSGESLLMRASGVFARVKEKSAPSE